MSPRHRHYRAPTKPLLTAWARHLDAVMRERDLSQTNVFDAVREEMGYSPTSRSAIVRVFSDKEPDARLAEVLTRHFGTPPAAAAPAPVDLSLLERQVLAAERQADAAERAAVATEQQVTLLAALLTKMTTPDGQPGVAPALVTAAEEWAARQLAASPLRLPDPASTPE